MMNSNHVAVGPKPASPGSILEQAIDNLLLGILIFDVKREVVFCNKRYIDRKRHV